MADFIFNTGPQGRGIRVDSNGRLLATGESLDAAYIYAYGNTGRAMGVDASGRLKINMSLITGTFETLQSASGVLPTFSDYNNFYLPIEDNATITPPIPANIAKYMFVIKQSASGGGNTITFNNTIWAGGVAPMLTAASGSVDVVFLAYVPPLQKYIGDFRADWS